MNSAVHNRRGRFAAALAVAGLLVAVPKTAWATPTDGLGTWNFHQIHVTSAVQSTGHNGSGVVVAVVDTWVDDSNKPEFGSRVLPGADCADKNGTCTPGRAKADGCGHGTHVTGTIASTSWGVAPKATILPVRVLTNQGNPDECTGSTDDVAAGIRWATSHGARVINLSLAAVKGVAAASPVTLAVQAAVKAGIVVVFAAGNSDRPVADAYGGRALIVAATGPSGGLASYSQHGAGVSVAAPGGDPKGSACAADGSDCVISTWLTKTQNGKPDYQYAALAGTSMAAPHVSGLAALLIAAHPADSESQVVDSIESTATPMRGAGKGRVNAAAALGVSGSSPATTHSPSSQSPKPSNQATQAAKGSAQRSSTARTPSPTASAPGGGTSKKPPGQSPTQAQNKSSDGKQLPVLPTVAAGVLLVGLSAGLVVLGRRGFA